MPSKSKAQQRLIAAAEHGASFPMARKVQQSMTHSQMQDFAVGSMKGKPAHVAPTAGHKAIHNLGGYAHPKKGR
jgi:phage gpG-like protein